MKESQICAHCGTTFIKKSWQNKYCSYDCSRQAHNAALRRGPLPERTCKKCNKTFTPKHHVEAYCSNECRYANKLTINRRYNRRPASFTPEARHCKKCNTPFLPGSCGQRYCDKCRLKRDAYMANYANAWHHRRAYALGLIDEDEV